MTTFRQPFQNEWPITQYYGETITSQFHTGIDYGCPLRTTILASESGTIMYAGFDNTGYGNTVIIRHDQNYSTLYAHLSLISVSVGQYVRKGAKIGESGNTGYSTGPHLHFEARKIWNDYKSHFNPMDLPLMSVDDSIENNKNELTIPERGIVTIVAPSGAYGHNDSFSSKVVFPKDFIISYTGNKKEYKDLTFCECTIWIAAHDGETQILKNLQ